MHFRKLIGSLVITLGTGIFSALLSGNLAENYGTFVKPPLSPPGWIFGPVWTVLFILMGISLYFVRTTPGTHTKETGIFYLQLFFNFFWSILFFRFGLYCFSAWWLAFLILLVGYTIYLFYRVKPLAGGLLIPYLLWCLFAHYLNIGVCVLN
ncbi:MAG: tryptophan-rich sensory protein [Clostridia bacterium]|nr:tryptophan-rich sensory protein [Clostridia bacterium]